MIPSLYTDNVGFSESEQYLGRLAQQIFLSFWSHPNLFRAPNRELADLIIIFGDDIIVFSDKSCKYKAGKYGWSRWYRRAVFDSAHQLHRAADWIRKCPSKIYMDAKCERPFPLHLPTTPRIHLVAIATGARDAAILEHGGDGSLGIATDSDGTQPFVIGDLDSKRDFVHVFDDASLTVVLRERDTVADFVAYLQKRGAFLRSGSVIHSGGELDLLEHYLRGMNGLEHDFIVPRQDGPPTHISLDGDWDRFVSSGPYLRKKVADGDSYCWDRIIEDVAGHADRGTLVVGQEHGLPGLEELLRYLAAEDRLSRRMLAEALLEVRKLATQGAENVRIRTTRCSNVAELAYVFLVARRKGTDEPTYRRFRQQQLCAHAEITKLRFEDVSVVVGIGLAPADDPDGSVDLAGRTYSSWSQQNREDAEQLCKQLGWARDITSLGKHSHHDEYPAPFNPPQRTGRSDHNDSKAKLKQKRKAQRAARRKTRR